jgi:hypothetical protein
MTLSPRPSSTRPLSLEDIKIERNTDRNIARRLPKEHPAFSDDPAILDRCEILIRRTIDVALDKVIEEGKIPDGQIACKIISGDIVIDGDSDMRLCVAHRKEIIDNLKRNIKQYIRVALEDYCRQSGNDINVKNLSKKIAQTFSKLFLDVQIELIISDPDMVSNLEIVFI